MTRIGFVYQIDDRAWQGGKNYYSSLFRAVHATAANDVELVLITGCRNKTALPAELPFLRVVRTPLLDRMHPRWFLRQLGRAPSSRHHDPMFARLVERHGIDLLSHSEPLRAPGSRVKLLGWVPDFQFLDLPSMWDKKALARVHRDCTRICRESDALVLSSHAALADLRRFAPWYDKPAHVLHFVSAPIRFGSLRTRASLQEQYALPSRYLHLPNQFWVHKNHRVVVDALALLEGQGEQAVVVCTGATADFRRPNHFAELMQHCRNLGVEDRFRVLGMVPYSDVQALMWHSHAVINPSRFEGWSTTVEEARTMGKRMLLSDIPVHREQAPPGSLHFGVDDPTALAAAMHSTLSTEYVELPHADLKRDFAARQHRFGQRYLQIAREI